MDTKDKLADLLEHKMASTPLDDIRVVDLIQEAHISKPTFYRHFQDKYALLEYCFRRIFDNTFGRIGPYYPFSQACLDVYRAYREKQSFLQAGYRSKDANGLRALETRMVRETYSLYMSTMGVPDVDDVAFALDMYAIGTVQLTEKWVLGGMSRSNEDEVRLLLAALPKNIAPYFH